MRVSGSANKVTKIKNKSEAVLGKLKEQSFDIIYIDGSHLAVNVLMDAMLSWPLLKPRGIMIFDDYAWLPHKPSHERPQMAIDMCLKTFATQLELLHKDYQVVVRKQSSSAPLGS